MVFHEPDVCNHHIKNVFTDCLDIAAQLQFLAVQQHHSNLPLHILCLTALLVRKDQNEKSCGFIINGPGSLLGFQSSPLLRREPTGRRRARWPSSQILAHESSIKIKRILLDTKSVLCKGFLFWELFLHFLAHHSRNIAAHISLLTFCCNQVSPEEQDSLS